MPRVSDRLGHVVAMEAAEQPRWSRCPHGVWLSTSPGVTHYTSAHTSASLPLRREQEVSCLLWLSLFETHLKPRLVPTCTMESALDCARTMLQALEPTFKSISAFKAGARKAMGAFEMLNGSRNGPINRLVGRWELTPGASPAKVILVRTCTQML